MAATFTQKKDLELRRSATIGAESWRNATLRNIRLAQTVARKSDNNVDVGKAVDPLPNLRDIGAQMTNKEIHKYNRESRIVLSKLRASLLDINTEIKALLTTKEELDKWHEYIRKDLFLNKECSDLRTTRPQSEKEHDGADDLLDAEKNHLKNIKKSLETQLKLVQQHLLILDKVRARLFTVQQERSRVLDLVCHTITMRKQPTGTPEERYANTGNPTTPTTNVSGYMGPPVVIDPLTAYTPESNNALADATEAKSRSVYLRGESGELVQRSRKLQLAAHNSVNNGMIQKLAETTSLKGHLTMGVGENKHAIQKSQKWFDASEIARLRTMGPESSRDLTVREHLNRPLVKVFQRHPGNQVPEGRTLAKCGNDLLQSMTATGRNIGMMNITQERLENDLRSKTLGAQVDADVVRLRNRKANHRWPMGSAF